MSENETVSLPRGWVRTTLGAITEPTRPRQNPQDSPDLPFIGMEHIEPHSMRLLRTVPARTLKSSAVHFWPGDILYGRLRPYLNKVYRPDFEGLCSAEFIVFPSSLSFEARYLQYLLNSTAFVSFASHLNEGERPRVDFGMLKSYPVPLPPFSEQTRIVEEIERRFSQLDVGVAALERAKANLKNYRASVLQAACEGRLVPTEAEIARTEEREYEPADQLLTRILKERRATWEAEQLAKMEAQGKTPKDDKWKAKYKEPAGLDTSELPELPEGWILASLEQITSATRVICYGILMPKENVPDGIPYVRVKDMKGDRIDLQALHRTAPEIAAAYARASLKPRDVLLAIRGTYGRVAEVPNELDGGNITQDTARLAVSDLVYHRYVSTLLRSPDAQNYFKRVARGVAVKGVNIADVKLTPIMLPPLPEQLRIVTKVEDRLSILDKLEVVIAANLKRAGRLRQAILKQAFEGNLVPQDSNDEPASVLLERTREERARKTEEEKAKRKPARKKKERKRGVSAQRIRPERDVCLRAVSE